MSKARSGTVQDLEQLGYGKAKAGRPCILTLSRKWPASFLQLIQDCVCLAGHASTPIKHLPQSGPTLAPTVSCCPGIMLTPCWLSICWCGHGALSEPIVHEGDVEIGTAVMQQQLFSCCRCHSSAWSQNRQCMLAHCCFAVAKRNHVVFAGWSWWRQQAAPCCHAM